MFKRIFLSTCFLSVLLFPVSINAESRQDRYNRQWEDDRRDSNLRNHESQEFTDRQNERIMRENDRIERESRREEQRQRERAEEHRERRERDAETSHQRFLDRMDRR